MAREAAGFARALPDPGSRARYEGLASSAASRLVSDDLVASLETMLEMLLERSRVSNRSVLQAVFNRTPRGAAQLAAMREVNRALETLDGQVLERVRFGSSGPSQHSVVIETDRCRLTLDIGRGGAFVSSLELG